MFLDSVPSVLISIVDSNLNSDVAKEYVEMKKGFRGVGEIM